MLSLQGFGMHLEEQNHVGLLINSIQYHSCNLKSCNVFINNLPQHGKTSADAVIAFVNDLQHITGHWLSRRQSYKNIYQYMNEHECTRFTSHQLLRHTDGLIFYIFLLLWVFLFVSSKRPSVCRRIRCDETGTLHTIS